MKRIVLTGNFDGIHLGHQSLLDQLRSLALAQGLKPCVISFSPHTRQALHPHSPFQKLSTHAEKTYLLSQMGLEHICLDFESVRELSPQAFVQDILIHQLEVQAWIMGFDHRFGKHGSGTATDATQAGIEVHRALAIRNEGHPISSSRIRGMLSSGNLDEARALLGRPYFVRNQVQKGDQIGRTIGFPTANLALDPDKLLPPSGVYAGYASFQGQRHPAVAHFGNRPTLSSHEQRFEIHLMDFSGDLYDLELQFEFIAPVRGVQKFEGLSALQKAIQQDLDHARVLLSKECL